MLIDTLPPRIQECSTQTLANTAYALVLLNLKHRRFWKALSEYVPEHVHRFKAQELAILLYACALTRAQHDALLQTSCENAQLRLHEFNPQNISNMVYALGLLRFVERSFLEMAYSVASENLEKFTAQGLSNMTYSLLGVVSTDFVRYASRKWQGHSGTRSYIELRLGLSSTFSKKLFLQRLCLDLPKRACECLGFLRACVFINLDVLRVVLCCITLTSLQGCPHSTSGTSRLASAGVGCGSFLCARVCRHCRLSWKRQRAPPRALQGQGFLSFRLRAQSDCKYGNG